MNRLHFEREVEDTATALFEFESGAHGFLSAVHTILESKDSISIYGTKGSFHVENLNQGTLRIVSQRGERSEQHPPHPNFHLPLIDDFNRAVMEDRQPAVTGREGMAVNKILDAIYDQELQDSQD